MTQTLAIFYDAYRSLNAKKMFWVVLVLSALVVGAFALIGLNEQGMKFAFWQLDSQQVNSRIVEPAVFYQYIFVTYGIGVWLAWLATILALVSTAGIFPDLITSGSIDLVVSKPIGRLRLFLTQYAGGLLFATLQVTIFTLASFLVLGFRGGTWHPGLFLAVPLVVCLFSYLFSVSVFLGVVTRSTVAAVMLTLLFWVGVGLVGMAEGALLWWRTAEEQNVSWTDIQEEARQRQRPAEQRTAEENRRESTEPAEAADPDDSSEDRSTLVMFHRITYGVKTALPKTDETVGLLERCLYDLTDLPETFLGGQTKQGQVNRQMLETVRQRPVWWVLGTSLGFEALVLALAAWIFCRRDF